MNVKSDMRHKRLNEVYEHLRQHYGIHTKSGFAEAIHYGRTSMSAALNGKKDYLTDSLFENICREYPGVFNIDYLLTGEGTLLTTEEDVKSGRIERNQVTEPTNGYRPQWADTLIDLLARQVMKNEEIARELREAVSEIRTLRDELTELRHSGQRYSESKPNVSPASEP